MGWLARAPLGPQLIDFLGHMRAPTSIVGLGALIDPEGRAVAALGRFGAGFIEVGPVAMHSPPRALEWTRDTVTRTLKLARPPLVGVDALVRHLRTVGALPPQLWVRISAEEPSPRLVAAALDAYAQGFSVEVTEGATERDVQERIRACAAAAPTARLALSIHAGQDDALALVRAAVEAGASAVWIRGEIADAAGLTCAEGEGGAIDATVLEQTRTLREALPEQIELIAGGVHSPADARARLEAGAQRVATDAGVVFSGPGLVKRCNEALAHHAARVAPEPLPSFSFDAARQSWFWLFLLGLSMLLGGGLALLVASTRVVLPYDEALCGMNRAQLEAINPRLLPFMAHDRVALAASMLSIGTLYAALAWHGIRQGAHWAHVTVVSSALAGFFSFFLFLGFGYFDPFHAFVSAVLLQLVLIGLALPRDAPRPAEVADWRETAAFRRALWGQLLFVVMGAGLIGAGLVITAIGCTDVFVREDLEFLRTTAAELLVAHERLVPLVAHDRASLGGMLLANGIAVLCSALWGVRAGAAWLWRAFAWAGNIAFSLAIGVHYVVGYDSMVHLLPAFAGWAIWWTALVLTRPWMVVVAQPNDAGAATAKPGSPRGSLAAHR